MAIPGSVQNPETFGSFARAVSRIGKRGTLRGEGMPREQPALRVVPLAAGREATESSTDALDLDALFRRYAPYVAAVAHRLLGRDDDVDDTVQEVFLAAVRGVSQVRDPAAVKGWLARVTVRSARQRLRKRSLLRLVGLDEPAVYDRVVDTSASRRGARGARTGLPGARRHAG